MAKRILPVTFPTEGLVRRLGYATQPPRTTPYCLNVFPDDTIHGRERGGSRSGLGKLFATDLIEPIQMLNSVRYIDNGVRATKLVAISDGKLWHESSGAMVKLSTNFSFNAVRPIQSAEFEQKLYIADYAPVPLAAKDGAVSSGALTSTALGNFATAGVNQYDWVVVIRTPAQAGTYAITSVATTTINLANPPSDGTALDFYVARAPKVYDPAAGTISLLTAENYDLTTQLFATPISDGVITGTEDLASATVGSFNALFEANDYSIADMQVTIYPPAASAGTYDIDADNGDSLELDGTLTNETDVFFNIFHTDTSLKGQVPSDCPLVCIWRGRLVFAGAWYAPHAWFASRLLNPRDWDHNPSESLDLGRAVAGTNTLAGGLGEPINSLIPHSDVCLIMGCSNSLWILRGDPASGGELDLLSHSFGTVDKQSWCYTPEGYLWMMGLDGLYVMAPGCGATPVSVSRERLPEELLNISAVTSSITMEYDTRKRCLHLYITDYTAPDPDYCNTENFRHWMIDVKTTENNSGATGSFWPVKLQSDHEPWCVHARRGISSDYSVVALGCRDGFIRRYQDNLTMDDSVFEIESYVDIGPYDLSENGGYSDAILLEVKGQTARSSQTVSCATRLGNSAEEAYHAQQGYSIAWDRPGMAFKHYPRSRGAFCILRLSGKERWAMESIVLAASSAGKQRV